MYQRFDDVARNITIKILKLGKPQIIVFVFQIVFPTQKCVETMQMKWLHISKEYLLTAGPRGSVGNASDSRARGPGLDTRSGHILSFFLPLIQEGQLSVSGGSMWLTP